VFERPWEQIEAIAISTIPKQNEVAAILSRYARDKFHTPR